VATVLIGAFDKGFLPCAAEAGDGVDHMATDPFNASYRIDGQPAVLVHGRCERPAAPGSAITVRTVVRTQEVCGDMDDHGDEDAALVLVHDPGGSETLYCETVPTATKCVATF
jgi:hypothetical protein